jgi:hypothetical protein
MKALPSLSIFVQLTLEGVGIILEKVTPRKEVVHLLHLLRKLVLELHYGAPQNFLVQLRYVMQISFWFLLSSESRY